MATFRNAKEEEYVNLIIDDLLLNKRDALRNSNITEIYDYIYSMPETQGPTIDGSIVGKVTEILIELEPNLLQEINELPEGFFYGFEPENVTIYPNVTRFGMGVFGLSNIKTINFEGTEEQWNTLCNNSAQGWNLYDPQSHIEDKIVVNCSDRQNIYDLDTDVPIEEAMTPKEVKIHRNLCNYLKETGFNTFGEYLDKFHVNLVTSEEAGQPFVAAISPERGIIYINPTLDQRDISIILRHEIAHDVFKHNEHMIAKLKALGINTPSDLAYELENLAGDHHISNYIYDKENGDYYDAKHILVDGEEFPGLVCELDFPENPEYWTMDFDQLWDVFVKDYDVDDLNAEIANNPNNSPKPSDKYVQGWNKLMNDYYSGKISAEDIEDWYNRAGAFSGDVDYENDDKLTEDMHNIKNPFNKGSDQDIGYRDALKKLARSLFSKGNGVKSKGNPSSDPRLIQPPARSVPSEDEDETKSYSKSKSIALTPEELKALMDKVEKMRDKNQDVIDDAGNIIDKSEDSSEKKEAKNILKDAQSIDKQLDKLENDAEDAKTKEDANKIAARLKSIKDFWDKDAGKNIENLKKDKLSRETHNRIRREIQQARKASLQRNYSYATLKLDVIINNIINTIRSEIKPVRTSDYAHYNSRSSDLGYVAPGRYTSTKIDVPKVLFYFDYSGSWKGNKEKIHMGHRIEESLKVLDKKGQIQLIRKYFADTTSMDSTEVGGGNSDAPVPDILELIKAKEITNVIIMTDQDPHTNKQVVVPGYAWLLFYDTVSESFATNISGKKGTKIAMIDHSDGDKEAKKTEKTKQ